MAEVNYARICGSPKFLISWDFRECKQECKDVDVAFVGSFPLHVSENANYMKSQKREVRLVVVRFLMFLDIGRYL